MLFVDHDQAQARQGGEQRQAGAQQDVGLAARSPQPSAQTVAFGQAAVDHRQPVAQARAHAVFQLRGQIDFRHQQQHLPPRRQHLLRQTQIELGLAAAGHAVQQGHTAAGRQQVLQPGQGTGLGVGQDRAGVSRCRVGGLSHGGVHADRPISLKGVALALAGGARRPGPPIGPADRPARRARAGISGGLAQRRRQHRQQDLAQRPVVIVRREFRQTQPVGRHGRQIVQHRLDRPHPVRRHAGRIPHGPHHAHHGAAAERHPHTHPGRHRPVMRIIEQAGQRHIQRHGQVDRFPDRGRFGWRRLCLGHRGAGRVRLPGNRIRRAFQRHDRSAAALSHSACG